MRTAMIFAWIVIAALVVILFLQWRTIQKLIPAPDKGGSGGSGGAGQRSGPGSFGDMVKAVQDELQPKEISVKF